MFGNHGLKSATNGKTLLFVQAFNLGSRYDILSLVSSLLKDS